MNGWFPAAFRMDFFARSLVRDLTKYRTNDSGKRNVLEQCKDRARRKKLMKAQKYANARNVPRSISCMNYDPGTYYRSRFQGGENSSDLHTYKGRRTRG